MPTPSHAGRCHLRFTESRQLSVPHMRTYYGDRSFAVNSPVVWNSFTNWTTSGHVFRKQLKTFLMTSWHNHYPSVLWWVVNKISANVSFMLLHRKKD